MCQILHGRETMFLQECVDYIHQNMHKKEIVLTPISEATFKRLEVLFSKEYRIEYDSEKRVVYMRIK